MPLPRPLEQPLRDLVGIQSPSLLWLGRQPPTPRWVRAVWAGYDALASLAWGVLAVLVVLAPAALVVGALLLAGVR